MDIVAEKQALRDRMRTLRSAIDPARRESAADDLRRNVLGLPAITQADRVLTFLSFGDEIAIHGLNDRLLADGVKLYITRIAGRHQLTIHAFPCPLEPHGFGLTQPRADVPAIDGNTFARIDCALVPGLAFDREGRRLGYGAGFYDRLLVDLAPASTIGVAFDEQVVDHVPTDAHDVAMHCVTTDRVTTDRVLTDRGATDRDALRVDV